MARSPPHPFCPSRRKPPPLEHQMGNTVESVFQWVPKAARPSSDPHASTRFLQRIQAQPVLPPSYMPRRRRMMPGAFRVQRGYRHTPRRAAHITTKRHIIWATPCRFLHLHDDRRMLPLRLSILLCIILSLSFSLSLFSISLSVCLSLSLPAR